MFDASALELIVKLPFATNDEYDWPPLPAQLVVEMTTGVIAIVANTTDEILNIDLSFIISC